MIEIQNITKTYNKNSRNANTVLDNASLTLPDKGLVFIVGESGIGKSTILNAIGGLMKYEGQILYDKKPEDIERYRRKNISYIFQDFMLFNELSVRDNIKIALNIQGIYDDKEISRRVDIILKAIHLNINPKRRTAALSLGQRQRVAIARALASDPKIILADEPTGNLDSQTSMIIMDLLKAISKDRLVLIVTHNINIVELYGDEAYRIINKKFEPLDPASLQGADQDFSKNKIYVDEMKEEDFQSESTLFKFYTGKEASKQEIKIINDHGKIMIIGDNITVVSPSQLSLHTKHDEENKKEVKEVTPINLDFKEREEKRSFGDSPFASFFRGLFSFRESKNKRKGAKFFHNAETLVPLAGFIFVDIFCGVLKYTNDASSFVGKQAENQIVLASDPTDVETRYYDSSFLNSIMNEESGLTYMPSEVPTSYLGNELENWSLSVASEIVSTSNSSYDIESLSNKSVQFYDKDVLASLPVFSDLKKYDLKDNEIVLDKTIFRRSSYGANGMNLLPLRCYNGKTVEENLVESKFYATEYKLGSESEVRHEYTIKGLVDIGYNAAYTNKATYDDYSLRYMKQSSYGNYRSNLDMLPYPSLEGITFTTKDALPSGYTLRDFQSAIPAHSVINQKVEAIVSKNAQIDFYNTALRESLISIDNEQTVDGLTDAEKVVCFSSSHSEQEFFTRSIASKTFYAAEYDAGLEVKVPAAEKNETHDPIVIHAKVSSAYKSHFGSDDEKALGQLNEMLSKTPVSSVSYCNSLGTSISIDVILKVDGFIDGTLDTPIKVAEASKPYLDGNYRNLNNLVGSVRVGSTSELVDFAKLLQKTRLFTKDVKKTKAYFASNKDKLHIVAYSIDDIAEVTVKATKRAMLRGVFIGIAVMVLILVLLEVMDNISRINKDKIYYGILRCLGKTKAEIIRDDIQKLTANALVYFLLPIVCMTLFLLIFQLYYLGLWFFVFVAGVYGIMVLSSEIPLMITLSHDPIQIMRTLQ